MITLRDRIKSIVYVYHSEINVAPDPQLLTERIMEEIKDHLDYCLS